MMSHPIDYKVPERYLVDTKRFGQAIGGVITVTVLVSADQIYFGPGVP
jgi:hypothetical protein